MKGLADASARSSTSAFVLRQNTIMSARRIWCAETQGSNVMSAVIRPERCRRIKGFTTVRVVDGIKAGRIASPRRPLLCAFPDRRWISGSHVLDVIKHAAIKVVGHGLDSRA